MSLLKNNLYTFIILCAILVAALFIRVYNLGSIPSGFHIDEASLGYNGYSLLLTGKDENNHKLPLYIDMFGDNRPSGYHYLTIVPLKFLGLTEFATRLPGVLFGAFTVIPFFFLAQILFKRKKISLIAAFLLSIAPWSIVLSRASDETIVALFLIILGYAIVILGLQKKKALYFLIGILSLSLSFFFYHTPRVFVPLLFLFFLAYLYPLWKKFEFKKKAFLIASFLILSFVSFVLVFLIKGGTGRFSQVSIFQSPGIKLLVEQQIGADGVMHTPAPIARLIHNKATDYSLGIVSNYFEYFTGQFLFIEGGRPLWYKVPAMGLIYLVELPFILLGIFYLLSSKDPFHKLPLIWLLVAPITAAFTIDDIPNINRAVIMFPMIELIAAYGFVKFSEQFKDIKFKAIVGVFGLLLIFNFSYFFEQYFVQSQVIQNWYRYEGFSQMMQIVKKDYSTYDQIVVTKNFGGIYPLILFYMKYNPATYQKEGSPKDKEDTGFGKFFFVVAACPSIDRDPKVPKVKKSIYIDSGTCPGYKGLNLLKHTDVYRKDGTKAFRIVYE